MTQTKSGAETVNPYSKEGAKGEQVERMFDSIAHSYDAMNTAMTLGLHRWWRNRTLQDTLRRMASNPPKRILDIATGTGDVAFDLCDRCPDAQVLGIDLSSGMLSVANAKLSSHPRYAGHVEFRQGDSLNLDLEDSSQDLITVAYGVRNFERLRDGYKEMLRVLRPGGMLCVIELSRPAHTPARQLYDLYTRYVIPAVGKIVSGDSRAYTYLPESIAAAPQRSDMTSILKECGFSDCSYKSFTFGVATCYMAQKK